MSKALVTARAISEDLLDRTRTALMSGNFEGFAACFHYPQELDTFDGTSTIHDEVQLEKIFREVRKHYRSLGVSDLVRNVIAAEFRGNDTVLSTHETRLFAGSVLKHKPYPVFSVIKKQEGAWKVQRSQYAIDDMPRLSRALLSGEKPSGVQNAQD